MTRGYILLQCESSIYLSIDQIQSVSAAAVCFTKQLVGWKASSYSCTEITSIPRLCVWFLITRTNEDYSCYQGISDLFQTCCHDLEHPKLLGAADCRMRLSKTCSQAVAEQKGKELIGLILKFSQSQFSKSRRVRGAWKALRQLDS